MKYRLLKEQDIKKVNELVNQEINKKDLTYVGVNDEKIVGVISLANHQQISLLFVDKNYRGQGIARELVRIVDNLVLKDLTINPQLSNQSFFEQFGFIKKEGLMIKERKVTKRFNSYQEVEEFINSQKDRVYSLDNFKNYMDNLGNPQLALNCIHIGGTNGKGSTTNYIKEVLKHAGYKVATFTSPAMYSRLDIIRINDKFIDDQTMVEYANRYVDLWLEYEISMFEIEVFIAIMYFIDNDVDFSIFEVGLGGGLDATNIIKPKLAINTNIGIDHIGFLGDTYESIALNKAGIVKEGIDYLTGETKQVCLDIFADVCKKYHSNLLKVQPITNVVDGDNVSYHYREYDITLNTPAIYQVKNSALAIETLLYLKNHHVVKFNDDDLINGLYEAIWPGRFEVVNENPLIIIDGAHNKEGMDAFFECAKKYDNIKIIFSALKDKDYHHMIEKLLQLTNDVTICEFEHVRASDAKTLAEGFDVKVQPDFKQAIDEAFSHQGTVFVTGSLYFISKVRNYLVERKDKHPH